MNDKIILLVDDDSALVNVLALRCRALGCEPAPRTNALAALQEACREPPDLICLDVEMPGGNGLNACELLAGEPRWAKVPVVVLTGKTDCETIRRCHNFSATTSPNAPTCGAGSSLCCELLSPAGASPAAGT